MKLIRCSSIAIALFTLLSAIGLSNHANADPVRVAMAVSWPGFAMQKLAETKGLSEVEIELTILEDPLAGYSMLAAGQVDMVLSTIDYVPVIAEQDLPFVLISPTNPSYGVDQVVLAPGQSVESLKGQKISAPEAFIGQLLVAFWLDQNGLATSDVEWINLNADEALAPMLSGDLGAAYMYEPWISKLLENMDGAKSVANTSAPEIVSSGIFMEAIYASRKALEEKPVAMKAALKAYWEGARYWHENNEESNSYLADLIGWPVEDVNFILGTNGKFGEGGIYISSFDEAARFCGVLDGTHPLKIENGGIDRTIQKISRYWKELGLVQDSSQLSRGYDCSLMQSLVSDGYRSDFVSN